MPDSSSTPTVLQRIVFPDSANVDATALYVDTGEAITLKPSAPTGGPVSADVSLTQSGGSVHLDDFLSRSSMRVRAGTRLSFASMFNAFPASYWRRWTSVESVTLQVRTSGAGTLLLMKSNPRGGLQLLDTFTIDGDTTTTADVSLSTFGDGGWLWFDIVAGQDDVVLEAAAWTTSTPLPERPRVMMQITTMNKPDYCLRNLQRLGHEPDALALLDEILLVDQGNQKVADMEGFTEAAAALGGRLRIIDQANLGGSGGFARGMYESVQGDFDYVLLMDDDVEIEPESLPRMVTMAQLSRKPTIIGGLMYDIHNRSRLHTIGEAMDRWRFTYINAHESIEPHHDLAAANLRQTPWLHRRFDVDYNAWWMCLIPTEVIRTIGLSLPIFIKWDDAEYGVRAKAHGFPTVSMPGTGVWHLSWDGKDDNVSWQAYFHARNRFIAALLHSPHPNGGRTLREWFAHNVRHLLSLQYGTAAVRQLAAEDVLRGPSHLPKWLPTKLPEVREELARHSDSRMVSDLDSLPSPESVVAHGLGQPRRAVLLPWALKNFVRQATAKVAPIDRERPQTHVPAQDNNWWLTSQYDSALVSNAEGTAVSWYQRDPEVLRAGLRDSVRLYRQLKDSWGDLQRQYRDAFDDLTSMQTWGEIFDEHTVADRRHGE